MFVRTLASALETLALTGAAARAQPTLVFWKVAGVDIHHPRPVGFPRPFDQAWCRWAAGVRGQRRDPVRDMGSDLAGGLLWRREIESGARPGPHIKTAGQLLETRANVERMKREATVEPVDRLRLPIGTPDGAEAAVARLAKGGADLLKVRSVADVATLRVLANAARAHGLKLAGHPVAHPDTLIFQEI